MTDTTVKFFESTQSGAPSLTGSAGSLITVLDACLVNGYGSVTLDSLVISGNVATGTKSTGHGFAMYGSAGPVIQISGATLAGLNGEWRIASIPNAQTLTFNTSGISNQTATGTIAAKRAPAGWEKAFSGTNKAVYRALSGTRFYLRIDDTAGALARVVAYEEMTGVDTGTNPFPTNSQVSGGHYFSKLTPFWWKLFCDHKTLYLFAHHHNPGWDGNEFAFNDIGFGDFNSFKTADAYAAVLTGTKANNVCGLTYVGAPVDGRRVSARASDGSTLSVINGSYLPQSNLTTAVIGLTAKNAYPNPASGGLVAVPYPIWDSGPYWRGNFRGLYSPMHSLMTDRTIETTADGRVLFVYNICYDYGPLYAQAAFDLTGPW